MSPGLFDFRARGVELPGLRVQWNHIGQAMSFRDQRVGEGFSIGLCLDLPGSAMLEHSELTMGQGAVFLPGRQVRYRVPPKTQSLMLDIEGWLSPWIPKGGWDSPLRKMQPSRVIRLVQLCERLTQSIQEMEAAGGAVDDETLEGFRADVLGELEETCLPWGVSSSRELKSDRERRDLVKRIEGMLDGWRDGGVPRISAIAKELDVSVRTVHRVFRQWSGTSPYDYFQIVRLHRMRRCLMDGGGGRGAVSDAAQRAGFTHLGRASRDYRGHFGELPSDTACRGSLS